MTDGPRTMAKNKDTASTETLLPRDTASGARDWSDTLYLPKTEFPMRAGLPEREPALLERWAQMDLQGRLRKQSKGKKPFLLHDGPPYANGNIHIGTGLNKILKDVIVRSQQMLGHDAHYVPGWDCHGLPIEWKIEEQYRAKQKNKDDVPIIEFRKECRDFADGWIDVQRTEFKRLGVEGDWAHRYATMDFPSEARIAGELMKFAMNGALYRGSKPVMWSVVEKTALAEAEIEYQDYQSDMIWVKFSCSLSPSFHGVRGSSAHPASAETVASSEQDAAPHPNPLPSNEGRGGDGAVSVVIWTTTPWTIPGNRAISFSPKIAYGLYEVTAAPENNWAKAGDHYVLADMLAADVMKAAKVEGFERRGPVTADDLTGLLCAHPLRGHGYDFDVPLLAGDHVTDDTGTGFVHTAPGHGTDDFEVWMTHAPALEKQGIDTAIPFTVDADGVLTKDAPGFTGKRVLKENGDKGDANDAVIKALAEANALIGRGRLKHQYPHSWRSKKPVIYRNTPQWFIAMDKPISVPGLKSPSGAKPKKTIRQLALAAIEKTDFIPAAGENRLHAMIAERPDWVISRQRAWGVPITVFVHKETGEVIPNDNFSRSTELMDRIMAAFTKEGADAWFEAGARDRFLKGLVEKPAEWDKVDDILDVWFESGCTHAFVLEDRPDLGWPADLYLEGSDQHRGWFHSSLLEACGTRGRAPYEAVLTHGFVVAEDGRKMSKSLGNTVTPQDIIKNSGADILRLWVMASDYTDDLRIGPEILKSVVESYRKLRNTQRWLLGSLSHFDAQKKVPLKQMPELERLILHHLAELSDTVRDGYKAYDFKRVLQAVSNFCIVDLSAFYFDIRKDALYCDAPDELRRLASLTVLDHVFECLTTWLAPMLCFTMEEAWLSRSGDATAGEDASVHLQTFPKIPKAWRDDPLASRWMFIRDVRRAVTGALELERAAKRIGSSLEAAPVIYIDDPELVALLDGIDLAELCITSGATLVSGAIPAEAVRQDDVRHVGVVPALAHGTRCERSWRITNDVGSDPDYPTLSARDAAAVRARLAVA
jgi:isoleucyl-tRNA synthetase